MQIEKNYVPIREHFTVECSIDCPDILVVSVGRHAELRADWTWASHPILSDSDEITECDLEVVDLHIWVTEHLQWLCELRLSIFWFWKNQRHRVGVGAGDPVVEDCVFWMIREDAHTFEWEAFCQDDLTNGLEDLQSLIAEDHFVDLQLQILRET